MAETQIQIQLTTNDADTKKFIQEQIGILSKLCDDGKVEEIYTVVLDENGITEINKNRTKRRKPIEIELPAFMNNAAMLRNAKENQKKEVKGRTNDGKAIN
ncbi:MAG: hypothetical protein PHX08_01950 [Lachnospiraceae bacterium]|nr:hypothetical protein [Lachnospiraceae bacterium]